MQKEKKYYKRGNDDENLKYTWRTIISLNLYKHCVKISPFSYGMKYSIKVTQNYFN